MRRLQQRRPAAQIVGAARQCGFPLVRHGHV